MGSIRTLLAISVLVVHADPIFGLPLMNGDMAITCFFMISGFLMALILETKYSSKRRFYLNRALRIYPPYFAALLLSLGIFLAIDSQRHDPAGYLATLWERGNYGTVAFAWLSNLTLVGVDMTRYLSIDEGLIQFPSFLYDEGAGGHNLLFVPQSWTLALELEFYLLAPFVLRLNTLRILALAAGFYAFRRLTVEGVHDAGYSFEPISAFPLVLCYFLFGVVAYRLYRLLEALDLPAALQRWLGIAGFAAALLLVGTGYQATRAYDLSFDLVYLAFALVLPFLFFFARGRRWDAWAGEFSYPVYLFHFALAQLLFWAGVPQDWSGEATLLSTLLVSAAYIYALDRPLQRLRARIAAGRGARPERRVVEVPAR